MLPSRHRQRFPHQFGYLCGIVLLSLKLAAVADESYTVKPKDTLYDLARRHEIPVGQLAERNGLTKSSRLYVGQRLIIPSKSSPPTPARQPALNSSFQKAIDSARVVSGRWRYIVI